MEIRSDRIAEGRRQVALINAHRDRYSAVSINARVPWFVIGAIHMMESGGNFETHICNGDPLSGRTKRWPPGQPNTGEPPFTWEFSAGFTFLHRERPGQWSIENMLEFMERWNGTGYRTLAKPIHTPYLWAGSTHYVSGKFTEQQIGGKWRSVYDPDLASKQIGAAVLLRLGGFQQ